MSKSAKHGTKSDDQNSEQAKVVKTEQFEQIIDRLEKELAVEKEARLIALADFQNFKKRVATEQSEISSMLSRGILNNLMEIIDDYNRSLDMDATDEKKQLEGLKLVFDKLKQLLTEQGLQEIPINKGDKFDPESMEAISSLKAESKELNQTVVHVLGSGYKDVNSNKIIRTAKVIIAKI